MLSPCLIFFSISPAPTHTYTLSLHDALPIFILYAKGDMTAPNPRTTALVRSGVLREKTIFYRNDIAFAEDPTVPKDRKSTRLNSSHRCISYAVFCLKKKKNKHKNYLSSHMPH